MSKADVRKALAKARCFGMLFATVGPNSKHHMNRKLFLFSALAISLVFTSCSKEKEGQTKLTVMLTDNPFNATEVNVEIVQVRVNFSGDDTGWIDLETNAGIYNLLELQNGVTTPLAQGTLPTETVKEIRFVLGDENSIKIGTNVFPLTIPSGSESGLKIKVNKQLNASLETLVIDFDAALSIIQQGNGDYKLKPVLKVKE
jgi:hypothetical protein